MRKDSYAPQLFSCESNFHGHRFFQVFFSVSDSKMEEGGGVMVQSF